jgi:methyl halide transferase
MMPHHDWDERYTDGEAPWDTGEPDNNLVEFIGAGSVRPGRVLEIGCGTGTNAVWLAKRGFTVLGVDVSSVAIERAREKATATSVDCRFEQRDFLHDELTGSPFDFVFDLGCLHCFDEPADRARFASRVASLLHPDGCWLSLIGSTEGPEREWGGPPCYSAREVTAAIEPALKILALRAIKFHVKLPEPALAWLCLSRLREVPARPSTRD